jgi:hypothetical protein
MRGPAMVYGSPGARGLPHHHGDEVVSLVAEVVT